MSALPFHGTPVRFHKRACTLIIHFFFTLSIIFLSPFLSALNAEYLCLLSFYFGHHLNNFIVFFSSFPHQWNKFYLAQSVQTCSTKNLQRIERAWIKDSLYQRKTKHITNSKYFALECKLLDTYWPEKGREEKNILRAQSPACTREIHRGQRLALVLSARAVYRTEDAHALGSHPGLLLPPQDFSQVKNCVFSSILLFLQPQDLFV